MAKTSTQLVAFVKTLLTSKANTWYFWGSKGETLTLSMINNSSYYSDKSTHRAELKKHIGAKVYDCAGIVDAFLGINQRARDYYYGASSKGSIRSIPEIPGIMVFNSTLSHTGVYIGNGQVIEAKNTFSGIVVTKLSEGNWSFWGKCAQISYVAIKVATTTRPVNPYPVPTETLYLGKAGMSREHVKWMQHELLWRYGGIKVDGAFGPITKAKLGEFQKNVGLSVDYKCGPLTRQKMQGSSQ